jgi:hypothetical protein
VPIAPSAKGSPAVIPVALAELAGFSSVRVYIPQDLRTQASEGRRHCLRPALLLCCRLALEPACLTVCRNAWRVRLRAGGWRGVKVWGLWRGCDTQVSLLTLTFFQHTYSC